MPFRHVATDVAAIMSAHVWYPALGSERPATLAPEILEDLLRGEMGFCGLIITDAMNMSGFLDAETGTGHPAVEALLAGCDLLLYPDDLETAINALREAAERKPDVNQRLVTAIARAEDVRMRYSVEPSPPTEDVADMTPAELALGCVTWSAPRPAWLNADQPIRVLPIWDDREQPGRPPFGADLTADLRQAGWNVDSAGDDLPVLILVASTPQAWKGIAGLTPSASSAVETALTVPAGALLIVFGHSRLVADLGGGICAWGTEPAMERAAARSIWETTGATG
jgi:hypothetical protein